MNATGSIAKWRTVIGILLALVTSRAMAEDLSIAAKNTVAYADLRFLHASADADLIKVYCGDGGLDYSYSFTEPMLRESEKLALELNDDVPTMLFKLLWYAKPVVTWQTHVEYWNNPWSYCRKARGRVEQAYEDAKALGWVVFEPPP